VGLVLVVLVVGVVVGMLVARPIGRLTEVDDSPDDD
jgi:uncharacterized membrane-anchored protein YhcB (DUF1043 family)